MFVKSTQQLPCDVLFSRLSSNRSRQLVGYGGRDGAIYVYPFFGYSPQARLEGLSTSVTSLAFSPDQATVVGGSDSGGLCLWDLGFERCIRTFSEGHSATITNVDMHTSGHFVSTVSSDTHLRIWDTRKSCCLQSYKDARSPLCAVQFSPSGKWVATGCAKGIVRLYDLCMGRLQARLELHNHAISSIHFHPEMFYLSVGSVDGSVSIWNLETFLHEFRSDVVRTPVDCVRFCGRRFLAASEHQLHVFDTRNLSDQTTRLIKTPWAMIGDLVYVTFSDEAWFVEASGSTAVTGRVPLKNEPVCDSGLPTDTASQSKAIFAATPATLAQPTRFAPKSPVRITKNHSDGVGTKLPTSPPPLSMTRMITKVPEIRRRSTSEVYVPRTRLAPQGARNTVNYVVEKPSVAASEKESYDAPAAIGLEAPPALQRRPMWMLPKLPEIGPSKSEMEMVEQLISTSTEIRTSLQHRSIHLHTIRSLWAQDQRASLQHLKRVCMESNEGDVALDFLIAMQQQRMKEKITVDSVLDLLDVIQCALQSPSDPLVLVALRTLRSMNTKFRARAEEGQRRVRLAQSNGHNDPLGVNSSGLCVLKLGQCAMQVLLLADRRDAIGDEARHIIIELPPPPRQC